MAVLQDPPPHDPQDKPESQEIIHNNDSNDSDVREEEGEGEGEGEENFIEDKKEEEKPEDYKPKTFKRIKGLVEKLKAKDQELEKLKNIIDEYKNDEEEINDYEGGEEDEDENKPLTIKAAKLLIERETKAEQINNGIKQALIELGFKTQTERAKYGKGLDKIALSIQQHRPDMSFKQAVKKAYEIKWEGVNKKEINDSVSGGSQNSFKSKTKILSPLVLDILKSKGYSQEAINNYLKNS